MSATYPVQGLCKKWQKLRYLKNVAVFAIGIFFCQIASRGLNSWRKRIAQTFLHFNLAAGWTESPQLPLNLATNPEPTCDIRKKSSLSDVMCAAKLIVCDETSIVRKGAQIPSWHPQMWNRLATWLCSSADNSSRTCQLSKNELQQTNSRSVQNQGNHNDLAKKHACAPATPRGVDGQRSCFCWVWGIFPPTQMMRYTWPH